MKKLILLLVFIPLVSFGQNQYISSKMSFIYTNDYKVKDERYIQDVLVKLVPKDINKNENIIVNINYNYNSIGDVNINEEIKVIKDEAEKGLKLLNTEYKVDLISSTKKKIYNKEIIEFIVKSEVPEYDITAYQLIYLYVENGKSCYILITYDDGKDYSSIAKYILKDFKFL